MIRRQYDDGALNLVDGCLEGIAMFHFQHQHRPTASKQLNEYFFRYAACKHCLGAKEE